MGFVGVKYLPLCAATVWMLVGCSDSSKTPTVDKVALEAKAQWEAKQAEERERLKARCVSEKDQLLKQIDEFTAAKNHIKARQLAQECAGPTQDKLYLERADSALESMQAAEVRQLIRVLGDPKGTTEAKVKAFEQLQAYKGKPAYKLAESAVKKYASTYEVDKRVVDEFRKFNVQPQIGWTKDQLVARKGFPGRSNRTTTAAGVSEQWVYCYGSQCSYVYLTNDIVTAYQD